MDDDDEITERRRDPRVVARIEVRFREAPAAARALKAFSVNFSAGGLCLRTKNDYAVGSQLRIALHVEKEELDLLATVAWAHKGAIGVRFEDVSEDDKKKLETLALSLVQM